MESQTNDGAVVKKPFGKKELLQNEIGRVSKALMDVEANETLPRDSYEVIQETLTEYKEGMQNLYDSLFPLDAEERQLEEATPGTFSEPAPVATTTTNDEDKTQTEETQKQD